MVSFSSDVEITLCVYTKNLLMSGNHTQYSPQIERIIMKYCINFYTKKHCSTIGAGGGGGGATPYNGLYEEVPVLKEVPFSGFFRYLKGPLMKIFWIDAHYGCIS